MGSPTIIQRRKIKVSIKNEPSTPEFYTKLAGPKPFQTLIRYKPVCPAAKDAEPSCEIQLRKESVEPKTKYLTVIEMTRNT